jgi:hypothetical protein
MKINYFNTVRYVECVVSWFHNLKPSCLHYLDIESNASGDEIIFEHWK